MANRVGIRGRYIDLYVQFSDPSGAVVNTDSTPTAEVIDPTGTVRRALLSGGIGFGDDPGLYRFSYQIPITGPDGYWTDRWVAKIGGETVENSFTFYVQESGTVQEAIEPVFEPTGSFTFTFTEEEACGIDRLMAILKKRVKSDGVRKVPDGSGGYIEEPCPVFSDDELICFLISSLSEFNQTPHFSDYSFSDSIIQDTFLDIIVQGAHILSLAAQALIEKGREFTITDNGVSYQPPQIAEMLNNQYGTMLTNYMEKLKFIKASLKPRIKGLGSWSAFNAINPAVRKLRHLRARQIL